MANMRSLRASVVAVTAELVALVVGLAAAALGKRFRRYSIATMVIVVACGVRSPDK